MRQFTRCCAAVVVLAMMIGAAAHDPVPGRSASSTDAIYRSFDEHNYQRAVELIESHLRQKPDDGLMLYNAACAHCRLGRADSATAYLLRAVKAGFQNFSHMRRDPDLRPLHGHPAFRALLDARDAADDLLAARRLEQWKKSYGLAKGYHYSADAAHRMTFVSALKPAEHQAMLDMLKRQADHMLEMLFESPPRHRVLIALPTADDAANIFQDPRVHGNYKHGSGMLIAADAGSSLRHEFVHVFHHAHMDELGQQHAIWIQEGLAALYEDYKPHDDGSITFQANERRNIVKAMAHDDRLIAWPQFFTMTSDDFNTLPGQHYAQARSIFEFLAERGLLTQWYRALIANFSDDPIGARAFEVAFDQPIAQVEQAWREWLATKPTIVGLQDPEM